MQQKTDFKDKAAEAINLATDILLEADSLLGIPAMKAGWQ
jgi:hypothetical protein